MDDFLGTVRATIQRYRLLRRGEHVLVAVSGGPDSCALLAALVSLREEWKLDLRAAYLDHGSRPAAARREAALVKHLGRLFGVPVQILRATIRKGGGESWEAAAREVRYEALARCAASQRCRVLAVGHTRDDQAETVLMWLLRGTGTRGLAGIPPLREIPHSRLRIIRPLLEVSRPEIEQFLRAHGIRPLTDRSNNSRKYLRNRIRHELIPFLEERFNPQVRRHLVQMADILREDLGWLAAQTTVQFRRHARIRRGAVKLNREALQGIPASIRRGILKLAVERLQGNLNGFGARHWMALERLLLNGGPQPLDFPHGLCARKKDAGWLELVSTRR